MEKVWLKHYPEDVKTEVDIPDITIPQMLENTVRSYADHTVITFYQHKISYRQLNERAFHFASALNNHGLQKGDRVGIMLPNCPQFVIAYYGILKAGGIVTQINPMLVERELAYILKDSGAETIVIYDALYPVLNAIRKDTAIKNVIVVSLQPSEQSFKPDLTFEDFLKKSTGKLNDVVINPEEDVAVLQYTGGTTGRSKGAMLTHRNLVANVVQSHEYFKHEVTPGKEKGLAVIPLFHVFGMTSCMNLGIYNAGNMILLPRFELEEVLDTIKREQPTIFPGVPTIYVALTSHPQAEKYGLDSIKICNSGSAPMPVEIMRTFEQKTGAKILEGYGLSEASPTTHCNPPFAERKPGSIGIGLPSTDYKIVDLETGTREVPVGELGELIVRGPQVMKGYWNMPEETAHTLRDGWLYTGDIARMDKDGYVYIMDRKKDMIIAGGYNVYPREVEEVLYEHPAVQEAVVVGVPDQYRGETVKAVLVLKEGKQASAEEIIAYCRENMAPYKVPKIVEFREELPKTSVGKILRRAIREESSKASG